MGAEPSACSDDERPLLRSHNAPAYDQVGSTAVRRSTYHNGGFPSLRAPKGTGSLRPVSPQTTQEHYIIRQHQLVQQDYLRLLQKRKRSPRDDCC